MVSPLYVAVMVIGFCTVGGAVYVMLHVPADNVHVVELNIPPEFPSLQVIVPVGTCCEFDVSATVTVTAACPPAVMVEGDAVTVTDVESIAFAATEYVPELV